MGGSQKSKRITWASDVNLCQVRLFLSDESPSKVGLPGSRDDLQAKALWAVHSGVTGSNENLPPGFEGIQPANLWRNKLSQIPLTKWKCPPRFVVHVGWQVVAGEESEEVEAQNQREMRVLEAIYPRSCSIPPNPSEPVDVENSYPNDQNTPQIPVTPIEDDDVALDAPSMDSMSANTVPMISPAHPWAPATSSSQGNANTAPSCEPDIVAAAQAALTAVMSSGDQKNFIDHNLLLKLLSDPKTIEHLVKNQGAPSITQNTPSAGLQTVGPQTGPQTISSSSTRGMPPMGLHSMPSTRPMGLHNMASTGPPFSASISTPSRPLYHPSTTVGPIPGIRPSVADVSSAAPSQSLGAPVTKDINYYKSLIQQHGGERQGILPQFGSQTNQEPLNNAKPRDPKSKIMKPCIFFNGPRGCRNGVNCTFLHERVTNNSEVHNNAKRMKADREISGT